MCLSCNMKNGEGIVLNPTLKPALRYYSTVITENISTIEYPGSQEMIDNLAAREIEHPITSISCTVMKSQIRTGEMRQDGSYSLECNYDSVKTDFSGSITKLKEENNLIDKLQGARAFGSVSKNKEIILDSIVNLEDESLRSTLEQSVSNMLGQIDMPNRIIQIGESFIIETPMKMPMENGGIMEMAILNTYRLDSVGKPIAYFTIDQQVESTTSVKESEFEIDGSGSGRLNYNYEYDTYELYETKMVMNSMVDVSGIKVKTSVVTKSTTKTTVEEPDDNTVR